MNDLVEWACEIDDTETDILKYTTIGDSNGYVDDELIVKVEKIKGKKPNKRDDWKWKIPSKYYPDSYTRMPDKQMAIQLLTVKFGWGSKTKKFNRLANLRNALPLIHGKKPTPGTVLKAEDAKEEDINSLIGILGSLVDKHKELIDKHEE